MNGKLAFSTNREPEQLAKLKRTKRVKQDRFIPRYVSKTNFDMISKRKESYVDKSLQSYVKAYRKSTITPSIFFQDKENVNSNSQAKTGLKRVLSFKDQDLINKPVSIFKNEKFTTTKQTHGFNTSELKIL